MGVAQLVRVPGCGPGGRRFDPDHPPQKIARYRRSFQRSLAIDLFGRQNRSWGVAKG